VTTVNLAPRTARAGGRLLWLLITAWLVLNIGGVAALAANALRAGPENPAPAGWPGGASFAPEQGRLTLVMTLHPHCACSRASIGELARIMNAAQGRVTAHVLVTSGGGLGRMSESDLARSAAGIAGVEVHDDPGGALSARFGAATSGHTVLFGPGGTPLFRGGITAGRGHAGDNTGEDLILALIMGGAAPGSETPTYGCPLARSSIAP
jgi:hypothetical protein